jgi:hypothetical protein
MAVDDDIKGGGGFKPLPNIKRMLVNEFVKEFRPFPELVNTLRSLGVSFDKGKLYDLYEEQRKFEQLRPSLSQYDRNAHLREFMHVDTTMKLSEKYMWKFTVDLEYDDGTYVDQQWLAITTQRELTINEAMRELEDVLYEGLGTSGESLRQVLFIRPQGVYREEM